MTSTTDEEKRNKTTTEMAASARQTDEDPFDLRRELERAPRPRAGTSSNIVNFYSGRSVLITGASGFMGKVLIEKLLRTCPDIKHVFVLIRPKYNKQPSERLRELLSCRLFDGIRNQEIELERQVRLVEGDITQVNMGLSSTDLARIIKEVSVIFHSAATVKFDEPLKHSVAINLTGTRNMIALARRIPHLASLVHVSTAYANCDRPEIDEHIYPVDMDPERLIELADWMDQESLQLLKKRFLGAKPNTYTYTKSLAEWLLIKSGQDLPVVICRPSIVVATAEEPFRGWIDNMNGPTGVILGTGKGLIRSMYAEREFVADLVPADKVINLIISLGWFANLKHQLLDRDVKGGEIMTEADFLLGSSGFSSSSQSGANSSAASTSGLDDSLQEDDIQTLDMGRTSDHQEQYELQKPKMGTQRRRPDAHDHRYHTNRHHHGQQISMSPPSGSSDDIELNSPDDESADLSLGSDCGSSASTSSTGHESHLFKVHELGQHHDEGYSGRYANSIASSTASDVVEADGQSRSVKQAVAATSKKSKQAPVIVTDTSAMIDHTTTSPTRHLNEMRIPDESQEAVTRASEEHRVRMRKMRQQTVDKLRAKSMPDELAQIPVFHCTSGGENPVTWGQIQIFTLAALSIFPSCSTFRYPCGSFTNNTLLDKFYALTLHYLPAYLVDFLTRLLGGKPMLVKVFTKFHQAAHVLKTFTSQQWQFDYDNRLILMELMNEEDRRLFDFDVKAIDWRQFIEHYVIGVRKFLLKEPVSNLEEARRNLQYVYYRNLGFQLASAAVGGYCALSWVTSLIWADS